MHSYERIWDRVYEAYDPNALRTRRQNHPIVVKWLADDSRGFDSAVNPLHFMHRPHFRNPVRRRRLRILNALIWVLNSEGFSLRADGKDLLVELRGHRTKFVMIEGTERPQRAVSETWRKLNGQLSCRIEAKLPDDVPREWADSPRVPLETIIPEIMASFVVWAEYKRRQSFG
jgi:hypothetical protein